MKTRLAICLALAAAIPAILPVSASAQALLPPYEIATSARSMGLEPISRPVLKRGPRYELRAIDRRGVEVKVAADALSGRILSVRAVGYGGGPVYATRAYPQRYPEATLPPRGGYEQPGNEDQQGGSQRQAPLSPGEPSVIYAPRGNAGTQNANPQPPARAPSAAKPAPKVAAKPPAKPAAAAVSSAPAEASPPSEQSSATTDGANAVAPPAPPVEKNPALTSPPVQAFD